MVINKEGSNFTIRIRYYVKNRVGVLNQHVYIEMRPIRECVSLRAVIGHYQILNCLGCLCVDINYALTLAVKRHLSAHKFAYTQAPTHTLTHAHTHTKARTE